MDFAYETITRYGAPFQASSAIQRLGNSSGLSHSPVERPATPDRQRLRPYTSTRFRLFPVRSPLLGESLIYFLFLGLLRWFSSPGSLYQPYMDFTPPSGWNRSQLRLRGCPIRISTDQSPLAAPRRFSQLATSFLGPRCQGIHRMLLGP